MKIMFNIFVKKQAECEISAIFLDQASFILGLNVKT